MTAVDPRCHWTAEDWAGFLLVIVPAGRLPVPADELRQRVRTQIERDTVLDECVTVVLAPPFEATPGWDRFFVTSVIEAAMPDGHFFAPRGLVGVVVVGERERDVRRAFDDIRDLTLLRRLGARLTSIGVQASGRRTVSPTSVMRIADLATELVKVYDQDPNTAVAEPEFLRQISQLIEEMGLELPALAPQPPDEELAAAPQLTDRPAAPSTQQQSPAARPETPPAEQPKAPTTRTAPPGQDSLVLDPPRSPSAPDQQPIYPQEFGRSTTYPSPEPSVVDQPLDGPPAAPMPITAPPPQSSAVVPAPPSRLPSAPPTRRLLEQVVYDGAEIVVVDQRTPIQKVTGQNPTDSETMDRLRGDALAIALVYLVFVPDDGAVSRPVSRQRNTIALELDKAFASVHSDATTNRPVRVAVEVLSATNPVQKHGILRVSGELTEAALPKAQIEYFNMLEVTEPLLDAARRTSRALDARDIEVASVHFIFLAAMRFPADVETKEEWVELLDHARVTWIDFSPDRRREPTYPLPPSPFGLHVLTDKEDVVAVVKKQSEVLYQFAPPTRSPVPGREPALPGTTPIDAPEAGGTPAAASPNETRRWWQLGKKPKD